MSSYAVIHFETTGLSPDHGARPTEIAVVIISGGKITDRYQGLMNPGLPIPYEIQILTGIAKTMIRNAPSVESVMRKAWIHTSSLKSLKRVAKVFFKSLIALTSCPARTSSAPPVPS